MNVKFKQTALAVAVLTLGLTSCTNSEEAVIPTVADQYVSIKVTRVSAPSSRAVEAPGMSTGGTIQLTNGHIFVIDAMGNVTHEEALNLASATTVGQTLSTPVSTDSRVYILGNIPTADKTAITALTTIASLTAATSAISTQGDYTEVALANINGTPAQIVPGVSGANSTVNVSVCPLISRMELVQVEGAGNITDFTVTGVYIDDYYSEFTYGGSFGGNLFHMGTTATFGLGDTGAWVAGGSPLVANAGGSNVWAHNVASGALPRFIIELDDIEYTDTSNGTTVSLTGKHYLTVTSYTKAGGGTLSSFERGKIYNFATLAFDESHLSLTPNPVDINLDVTVGIVEWAIENPSAGI